MQYGLQCLSGLVYWIAYMHIHINPTYFHFLIAIWHCNMGRRFGAWSTVLVDPASHHRILYEVFADHHHKSYVDAIYIHQSSPPIVINHSDLDCWSAKSDSYCASLAPPIILCFFPLIHGFLPPDRVLKGFLMRFSLVFSMISQFLKTERMFLGSILISPSHWKGFCTTKSWFSSNVEVRIQLPHLPICIAGFWTIESNSNVLHVFYA